ncbi:T9SS type A sorting domain-containing protein [Cryomorphaceae bacterium 1068]|nr:T9SS type A sorting domain-containing protein [Cryomorphaceae bacterium 1068]
MKKLATYVILACMALSNIQAQTTKKVLFIGNSYTAYNTLPAMVSNMATNTGDELIFDSNTPGGARFLNHATNPTTLNKIAADNWDYVALQAQSQETSFSAEYKEAELYPFAEILIDSIRSNYECSEPMFYMTWGRENGDVNNCGFIPWVCTYEGMDDSIRATYTYMADIYHTEIAPTGAVWRYLRENHSEIGLYTADGSHPSLAGSYAAACAFYTMIFKNDPALVTWSSTLPETTANTIRQAAKLIVFDELESWNYTLVQTYPDFSEEINLGVVTFTNTTENFDSLSWSFGDGNSSTEIDPTHIYDESGVYTVVLTTFKCGKSATFSKTISIELTLGTRDRNSEEMVIFPNPASDKITIQLTNPSGRNMENIRIFDIWGRIVASFSWQTHEGKFDVSNIPPGLYLIQLIGNNKVLSAEKLVLK